MCQRSNGAPVVVGVPFDDAAFHITQGEPKYFASSDIAERGFCGDCGSRLIYRPTDGGAISVEIGSLDHPEAAIYYLMGVVQEEKENLPLAAGLYQKTIALKPGFASAHRRLGFVYHILGDESRAAYHVQIADKLKPLKDMTDMI